MILIFAEKADVHAEAVEIQLRRKGGDVRRLNRDELRRWSLEALRGESLAIVDGQAVEAGKLKSVFIRSLPDLDAFRGISDAASENELSEFVANQRFSQFSDCIRLLSDCVPTVNSISSTTRAQSKALQLHVAERLGLQVPLSYLGANPEIAAAQIDLLKRSGKRICTKPVSSKLLTLGNQKFAGFTEILEDSDTEEIDSLVECPMIIQEYVEKAYELRISVVGDRMFACKIDSQIAGGPTAIDWRRYNIPKTPHTTYELPQELRDKLLAFHAHFGLALSNYDIVRSLDGAYVFLETNPFGRWLWIEDITGLEITSAIADLLLSSWSATI
jgi:glutathione synthase/RimK-type ligase-like ATP-grasp enzyme